MSRRGPEEPLRRTWLPPILTSIVTGTRASSAGPPAGLGIVSGGPNVAASTLLASE